MSDAELDAVYGSLCRAVSAAGEAGAAALLARFALLAIGEIDDAARVQALITSAQQADPV